MKKSKKTIISLIFFVLLIVLTLFAILRNTNISDLKNSLEQMNPLGILAGMGLMLLCVACEGECLRIVCKSLGTKFGPFKAFVYSCTDYYFSAITPSSTGGQPAMALYMSQDGIPFSKSCIAILLTLVEYMVTLVVLGIAALMICFDLIVSSRLILVMYIIGFVLSLGLIAGSLAAMFRSDIVFKIGCAVIKLLHKLHIIKHPERRIESFSKSLLDYKSGAEYVKTHPLISVRLLLICFVQRISMFMVTYCVYRGMGLNDFSVIEIIARQTIVILSITTLPLPGGVGAAEGMFAVVFADVFEPSKLTAAMLMTRGINFYFCMIFAGIVTLINHLRLMRAGNKK